MDVSDLYLSPDIYRHQLSPEIHDFLKNVEQDNDESNPTMCIFDDFQAKPIQPEFDSLKHVTSCCEKSQNSIGLYTFYDEKGILIDHKSLSPELLMQCFEFVVTSRGELLSKRLLGDCFLEIPNKRGAASYFLARLSSIFIRKSGDVRISYHEFKHDSQFDNVFCCSTTRKECALDCYFDSAYSHLNNKDDPMLVTYSKIRSRLSVKVDKQRLDHVGAWSRKCGIKAAFVSVYFIDVADCLEFYHVPSERLWQTRLGKHVCIRFIDPLLRHCVINQTETVLLLIAHAGSCTTMKIESCNTLSLCEMCNGNLANKQMSIDNSRNVFLDAKCASILDLMFLICHSLDKFRNTSIPNIRHFRHLMYVFAEARERLQNILRFV